MSRLYSSLKFLRFTDHLKAVQDGRVIAPVHIRIKPTNRCNHNCWYCAYRTDDLKLGEDMDESHAIPEAKMFEITEDIIEMGVKAVTFSGGGEPLLYKPLPDVIDRLAAGGVKVATLTNGANLKGRMAEAFAKHGTWVRISVDAWDDASYVKSRGAKPGEFGKLLDNIKAFTDTGTKCVLGISFIVGQENHTRLAEIAQLFKQAGANHVKMSGAIVSNEVAGNNAYHAGIKDEVARQIAQAQALNDDTFHVLNHYHDLDERFQKDYHICPFLQFLTVIGADLQVYTCQDKAYTVEGTLGSIENRRFKDYWLSEENRSRVFGFDPSKLCGHHCVSHAKNVEIMEYLSLDPEHGVFV
ncbi:radical SAM protein [Magnetospirillum sp. ME-1]|uniref:radical SAM protein n=1 Tax=Magnetospirillum sp. ME-1 TaxID=1639348 RepID=UPI000A17AED4|nr:radical SAM protein [Magnetospirillum sp. ME-1]ARJ66512.1 radical SAM protein [Magnetospirillum sp. ME-1]